MAALGTSLKIPSTVGGIALYPRASFVDVTHRVLQDTPADFGTSLFYARHYEVRKWNYGTSTWDLLP